jgi:small subunit ribosomal protein S9
MAGKYNEGIGRRKTSTARVRIESGNGRFTVNEKTLGEYFTRLGDPERILAPMRSVGMDGKLDVSVKVQGGGVTGQATAVSNGLARALLELEPEFRSNLRAGGFLTRDARAKERKKPGLKRARKAPTYTKR